MNSLPLPLPSAHAAAAHLLALSTALFVSTCFAAGPKAGEMAPDYVGVDYEDQATSLTDYRGKVVVVSFWASWCGPCLKEMPILERIQEKAGKDHMQVIAINTESRDVYRRVAKALGSFELKLNFDPAKTSATTYGVNGIPHMIIIDRTGHIVRINHGYAEEALDRIIDDINGALLAKD